MHNVPNCNQPFDPLLYGGKGGYYQQSMKTGDLVGLATGATIFSFRWAPLDPLLRAVLKFIKIGAWTTTAFGTAQMCEFDTYCAEAWTGADSGGTDVTPASTDQRRQPKYKASGFIGGTGKILIATTGALTDGTRAVDAQPHSSFAFYSSGLGAGLFPPIAETWDEHHVPMVFNTGEGFLIKNFTAFGATGTIRFCIDLMWEEETQQMPGW